MNRIIPLLVFLIALLWAAPGSAASKSRVFVTLPPQAYLVERISGETVEVQSLLDRGQDPHSFEPTPRQAAALGKAQVFFGLGLPFEKNLLSKALAGNRNLRFVDAAAGIPRLMMEQHHHHDDHPSVGSSHQHRQGSHSEEPDPHVWLAPANLRLMAANMARVLIDLVPEERQAFQGRLAKLDTELAELDRRLAGLLAPHRGKTIYVYHPAFGYFAKAYGLKQEAVETGGKSPSPKQVAFIVRRARQEGVKTIFVQPQFDPKAAQTVAHSIGGTVVPIDPLAKEVIDNLNTIATAINRSFGRGQ